MSLICEYFLELTHKSGVCCCAVDIKAVCWGHCPGSHVQQTALSAGTWQTGVNLRRTTWTT